VSLQYTILLFAYSSSLSALAPLTRYIFTIPSL